MLNYRSLTASLALLLISLPAFSAPVAILVNGGGGDPTDNTCDFYADLNRMDRTLSHWDRLRAATNGPGHSEIADGIQCDENGKNVRDPSSYLVLTHMEPDLGVDIPSKLPEIRDSALKKAKASTDNSPFLLYFTDHGGQKKKNGTVESTVALWGNDATSTQVGQLLGEIRQAKPNGNIILVSDHCFSGGIIQTIVDQGLYKKGVCGFAPASPIEESYMGQSFALKLENQINSSQEDLTFDEAFRAYQTDESVTSTPMSTSDIFAMNYFKQHEAKIRSMGQLQSISNCALSDEDFKNISKTASQGLAITLQAHADSLKKNLDSLIKKTKLTPDATPADVEKATEDAKQEAKKVQHEINALYYSKRSVKRAWHEQEMTRRFGKNIMKDLAAQKNKIDSILEKIDSPNLSKSERDELKKTLKALKEEKIHTSAGPIPYSELDVEGWVVYDTARLTNSKFMAFEKRTGMNPSQFKVSPLPADGSDPGNIAWPADIMERDDKLDDKKRELINQDRALKRLNILMQKSLAIQLMKQDPSAMSDYLTLIQCESTSVRQAPTQGKKR